MRFSQKWKIIIVGLLIIIILLKKKIELNVTEREKTREKKKSFPRKSLTVFQNTRDFFPGLIEDP